ncbi:MAG: hypothetical protein R6V13_02640 [Anaerolineae bacterium]
MKTYTPCGGGKGRHRWWLFASFIFVLVLTLFFLGLEQWEIWALLVIGYYILWCTHGI